MPVDLEGRDLPKSVIRSDHQFFSVRLVVDVDFLESDSPLAQKLLRTPAVAAPGSGINCDCSHEPLSLYLTYSMPQRVGRFHVRWELSPLISIAWMRPRRGPMPAAMLPTRSPNPSLALLRLSQALPGRDPPPFARAARQFLPRARKLPPERSPD